MDRLSNPRLMAKVLEAVRYLGETRGSSARQVLEVLKEGNKTSKRNLTMQVQRALKHAVTAGLLQLRAGRYKTLIAMQNAAKHRSGREKEGRKNPLSKKKEDPENSKDSRSLQPAEAGPKSRCSYCKKHKRRASRRKRKRSMRRKRQTKRAKERNSRRLRRRGEEETSTRSEGKKKSPSPGSRNQSEVPNGQRSGRTGKKKPDTSQDHENRELGSSRDRSESISHSEGEEEGPRTTRAKISAAGRKNESSSSRRSSVSKPRRSSRKRNSSVHNTAGQDLEETKMECYEEDGNQSRELLEEDAHHCEHNARSSTSI